MTYVLDNAHQAAATRLRILERLYDPLTLANLSAAGPRSGRDTWEVGAGAGSIAVALAHTGARVTATDIDLRHLSEEARDLCHVMEHDVTGPPPGTFDLIHARLVLSHLPESGTVLSRLEAALNPGGWLVVEELDPMLDYLPDAPADHLINRVGRAFTAALGSRGGWPRLGRHLPGLLALGLGLEEVAASATILGGWGGGTIADLMIANTTQTAPQLAEAGISADELDAYQQALGDQAQWITMPTFWAARGQAPS